MNGEMVKNGINIRKLIYLIVTSVIAAVLIVLSILMIVNATMNSGLDGKKYTEKSVYYDDGSAVLDSTAELAAMTVMPSVETFRVSVTRNKEFNFGVMSANFIYKAADVPLSRAGYYEFRGDKITNGLSGNTALGGSDMSVSGHDLSYIAKTRVYHSNELSRKFDSYTANDTVYYAAFAINDPAICEFKTADEVAARYIATDGSTIVTWVGYRTLDKENDIILGICPKNSPLSFGNTYNMTAHKGYGLTAIDAIAALDGRIKEIKLLEQLGFFGEGITLDLDKRAEYIKSGEVTPVVMFTVRCSGAKLHEFETAFPDVTLFDVIKIA